MVSLVTLRALAATRDAGSVTAAARALGYTPSAVSQQLARLQVDSRAVLLEPDGRTVRLTESGRVLADAADRILAQWEEASGELERLEGSVCGRVRLAAFPTAARGLAPSALAALCGAYPELDVRLAEVVSHQTLVQLRDGDADIAIAHDWPQTPLQLPAGTEAALLGSDVADVVLPAGHRLASVGSVSVGDLVDERWAAEPGSVSHDLLMHLFGLSGTVPEIAYEVREFSTQIALIAAGLAIGLVPRLGRGELPPQVAVVATAPPAVRRVYAVVRSSAARRPAIGAVVASLSEHWPADPGPIQDRTTAGADNSVGRAASTLKSTNPGAAS